MSFGRAQSSSNINEEELEQNNNALSIARNFGDER
jgi:hypothetical protein